MGTNEYSAVLVGIILPGLISLGVREQDPPWFKVTMTYLIYAAVALALVIINNEVVIPENPGVDGVATAILKTLAIVWGTADSLYRGVYKKTGLTTALERMGRK